jgi:hypothetical protein
MSRASHGAIIAGLRHGNPVDPAVMERVKLIPVAATEFLFVAHLLPLVITVDRKGHDLMMIVSPSTLVRQIVAPGNVWMAPYQPVFLRALAFQLVAQPVNDPLQDLLPNARAALLTADAGEPVVGIDGQPTPFVRNLHQLLITAQTGREGLKQALEDLLIAGVATPLDNKAKALTAGLERPPRLYSVSPSRLAQLSPLVVGRLARNSFLAIEMAHAIAFSRRWLKPALLPDEPLPQSAVSAMADAISRPAQAMRVEPLAMGFDESDLFQFP